MKRGFTLSEVLITLGIVGIVAVLTVPSVMKNYQNRLYTSQLQKVYSQISDATQAIMNDEHVDNFYETSGIGDSVCSDTAQRECSSGAGYFLGKYFKVLRKNCSADNTCATTDANTYKSLLGTAIGGMYGYCVQTVSGATICAVHNSAVDGDTSRPCTSLTVDVNGLAQPNVAGRDIFSIDIHDNGSLSDYSSGCKTGETGASAAVCGTAKENTGINSNASGCLNSILEAGWKMEY